MNLLKNLCILERSSSAFLSYDFLLVDLIKNSMAGKQSEKAPSYVQLTPGDRFCRPFITSVCD